MTVPRSSEPAAMSLTRALLGAGRYYLGGRRGLFILAGPALIAGLALNWSWLVAIGVAPILIGLLPCLAMCALGLCMNRAGRKSCATAAGDPEAPGAADDTVSTTQSVAFDTPRGPVAGALPANDEATLLTNSQPQPSKERRPTDA